MEDVEIVELYWKRDEAAIRETDTRYGGYCRAIARNILQNPRDAEEVLNDTYLHAWNSMPPHRPAVLSAFLGKLTRYAALKRWRDARAQKRGGGETALVYEELSDCLRGGESVELRLEGMELARSIDRFLSAQPATARRVFVCRYWYMDSTADTAAQFGFSQSKVKSLLCRTRGKLRNHLIKEGVYFET